MRKKVRVLRFAVSDKKRFASRGRPIPLYRMREVVLEHSAYEKKGATLVVGVRSGQTHQESAWWRRRENSTYDHKTYRCGTSSGKGPPSALRRARRRRDVLRQRIRGVGRTRSERAREPVRRGTPARDEVGIHTSAKGNRSARVRRRSGRPRRTARHSSRFRRYTGANMPVSSVANRPPCAHDAAEARFAPGTARHRAINREKHRSADAYDARGVRGNVPDRAQRETYLFPLLQTVVHATQT